MEVIDNLNEYPYYYDLSKLATIFEPFRIKNGSMLSIGTKYTTILKVDQHFNWFQKFMWKLCFGVIIKDYSEE